MTTLAQLVTGLDALDDFVRLRLRQAVAELRDRQDQIDATLARPDASPERRDRSRRARRRTPTTRSARSTRRRAKRPTRSCDARERPARSAPTADSEDEGPPQTWLV